MDQVKIEKIIKRQSQANDKAVRQLNHAFAEFLRGEASRMTAAAAEEAIRPSLGKLAVYPIFGEGFGPEGKQRVANVIKKEVEAMYQEAQKLDEKNKKIEKMPAVKK